MLPERECDYVVIGSGAGGGPLAARLAETGHRVVVLEAGGDPATLDAPGLPADYDVPAFHAFASENPAISWNYFVRHYADDAQQRRDPKYRATWNGRPADGVLYPRAGTLGGCTAHNAMILLAPPDEDWDAIAELTGDPSWRAAAMQIHWQAIEACHHRPEWRALRHLGANRTGHGWDGWLSTERAMPHAVFQDDRLLRSVALSALEAICDEGRPVQALWDLFVAEGDPNDRRRARGETEGLCYTPLTTRDGARAGARERLRAVEATHPGRLHIELDALATRILFDDDQRAVGVAYQKGARLFRAHAEPGVEAGEPGIIRARREVILAGGAFNSPHLLLLSGIGPAETLRAFGIDVRADLPGVGANLQDRYEISVVNRMAAPWPSLEGARFQPGDRLHQQWAAQRRGMYSSNGTALAVSRRSAEDVALPDLFCMALLAKFQGYYPGYAKAAAADLDCLSWAILKAHAANRRGTVTLRSPDPRDMPQVAFNSFDQDGAQDVTAVVAGIRFVRRMAEGLQRDGLIAAEEWPGPDCQSDADLAAFVRDNAWGHHASCSCPIGPREVGGVLDSEFRVHGLRGLRVVDASVFPRIPGFFLAAATYMVAEKAAATILAEAEPQQEA